MSNLYVYYRMLDEIDMIRIWELRHTTKGLVDFDYKYGGPLQHYGSAAEMPVGTPIDLEANSIHDPEIVIQWVKHEFLLR